MHANFPMWEYLLIVFGVAVISFTAGYLFRHEREEKNPHLLG